MKDFPENLKYAKTHEWAKLEQDNIVRVGITDFAQEELGDLVYVELPDIGQQLKIAEQCAVIESVKTASDLFSPATGEVTAVNEAVIEAPDQINDDAFATWLFCIKISDASELQKLMDESEYKHMIEE